MGREKFKNNDATNIGIESTHSVKDTLDNLSWKRHRTTTNHDR